MWPINPARHRGVFKKHMNTRFRTIIGSNHGKTHSRIWIEGERLVAIGFTVGVKYDRSESSDCITLTLNPKGRYKVSGKGSKPIIDITGSIVARVFPPPITHVEVEFERHTIRITQ